MSRENFAVKLTEYETNEPLYVMVHGITAIQERTVLVKEKDVQVSKEYTLVMVSNGKELMVKEKAKEIQTKAAAYGTFKIME